MKRLVVIVLCAGSLLAQEEGRKIRVPLRDPSRPARVHVELITGNISVRGADVKDVEFELGSTRRRDHESRETGPDGMKRLDLPGNSGIDVVEDNNVVTFKVEPWGTWGDLVITVPRQSSLQLKAVNSRGIHVAQVDGEIDVDEVNGKITLENVSGSVVAHCLNGGVVATLDRIDPSKPMSFSTLNGNIDVTLPADVKANVRLKTDNGAIYSDFEVRLAPQSGSLEGGSERQPDGAYHLRLDHVLRGTINGGGPDLQFTSFNGKIYVRKRK